MTPPRRSRDNPAAFQSPTGQSMDDPILTIEEREAINSGRWFSSLSPSLRHDILRCAFVKRYKDGDLIAARGDPPEAVDRLRQGRGARELDGGVGQAGHADLRRAGHLVRRRGDVRRGPAHARCLCARRHDHRSCVARADFQKILVEPRRALRSADAAAGDGASASCSGWSRTSTPCPCGRGWPSS